MTIETRKSLTNVWIELPVRHSIKNADKPYSFRADEFIDTLELSIIKSPEFKKELKNLIEEILK